MKVTLLTVQIRYERDVVLSRQRARLIAEQLGFDRQDQVRIATTVSELARNVFQYAKRGKVEFSCDDSDSAMHVLVTDDGPGIPKIKEILRGDYVSKTGMGLGLLGAKRLMNTFCVETAVGKGTTVTIAKLHARPLPLSAKKV